MLALVSLGVLLTVVLIWAVMRTLILLLARKRPLGRNWSRHRRWFIPLVIVVALFWFTPWQGTFGRWEARQQAKQENGLVLLFLPEEVRNLPKEAQPGREPWAEVMKAETGVRLMPPSSISISRDHDLAFQRTMEREIKRRFGAEIFIEVAQKAREAKGTEGNGTKDSGVTPQPEAP